MIRPGAIADRIGTGLQEVTLIAGLAAVGVVVNSIVIWWQACKKEAATPKFKVTFDLGGGKGD